MDPIINRELKNAGNELPRKKSIQDPEFAEIFGISAENTNYNAWKKIAVILDLKNVPTKVEDIKAEISWSIDEMD